MITMDYDGNSNKNEAEVQWKMQASVLFKNTIYLQQPNTNVINVMNITTKEIYRNISLFTQRTNLTGLVVMDTSQQQPIGELSDLLKLINHIHFGFIDETFSCHVPGLQIRHFCVTKSFFLTATLY